MTYSFVKGLTLNENFYIDVIKPLIDQYYPQLSYAAGLIGYGSDVLGFDTAISMDHNWGPRLILFLKEEQFQVLQSELKVFFEQHLPTEYKGFPTNFTQPAGDFTQSMHPTDKHPVNHLIEITTVRSFVKQAIGYDMENELVAKDWITFSEQGLLEITEGKVFYDPIGSLTSIRKKLKRFPLDVLRIKLAALWDMVANEEAFIGRCLDNKDEIGARLITARIVNLLMKICFYLEEQYIPYSKWFGSAFNRLQVSLEIKDLLQIILSTNEPVKIEDKLALLYTKILAYQNSKNITDAIDVSTQFYYGRPYKVVFANRIVEALMNSIEDKELKDVKYRLVGFEQKVDGMDFTSQSNFLKKVTQF